MSMTEKEVVTYAIDKDGNINERTATDVYKDGKLFAKGVAQMACHHPTCDEKGLSDEVKGLIAIFHTKERKAPFIARRLAEEKANKARKDGSITSE